LFAGVPSSFSGAYHPNHPCFSPLPLPQIFRRLRRHLSLASLGLHAYLCLSLGDDHHGRGHGKWPCDAVMANGHASTRLSLPSAGSSISSPPCVEPAVPCVEPAVPLGTAPGRASLAHYWSPAPPFPSKRPVVYDDFAENITSLMIKRNHRRLIFKRELQSDYWARPEL
jgi:hypothetical protein